MKNEKRNLIFDLDGTLIDSSESILETFKDVFIDNKIALKAELSESIIGPPLVETLSKLSDSTDQNLLQQLSVSFMKSYDNRNFMKTKVYSGINTLLEDLQNERYNMFIATNKRMIPAQAIINYFGWNNYFRGIYTLDSIDNRSKKISKSDVLNFIINKHNLSNSIYIGDRHEDWLAAKEAGISFLHVLWGYGDVISPNITNIEEPRALLRYLQHND